MNRVPHRSTATVEVVAAITPPALRSAVAGTPSLAACTASASPSSTPCPTRVNTEIRRQRLRVVVANGTPSPSNAAKQPNETGTTQSSTDPEIFETVEFDLDPAPALPADGFSTRACITLTDERGFATDEERRDRRR